MNKNGTKKEKLFTFTRAHIKPILICIGIVLLAFVIWLFMSGRQKKTDYLTQPVKRGVISRTVNATGEVSAVQLVSIGAQASGQIEKLHVVLGQELKKGDLIAEIDSMTQVNELNTNKARLQTYQSQLVSAQVNLRVAQTQYDREVTLMEQDATSAESLENARNALAAAKANVDELKSLIRQTQIAVSTSEVNLGYTRILATQDGTVVSIPVEEGQTVNATLNTPTIVQVADLSSMEIRMEISEGDVTKIRPGMPVTYTILSEPETVYETRLDSVDPGLTELSNGTYTGYTDSSTAIYYYGKLIVPNDEGKLRIGMTTQNVIHIAEAKDILLVPSMAIQEKDGKQFVQVLGEKDRITEKEVTTGLSDNLNIEIKSGLEEGERVILAQLTPEESEKMSQSNARPPRN